MPILNPTEYRLSFDTRAEFIATNVPAAILYVMAAGRLYRRDTTGTAATTADGGNWAADGLVTPQHFGAVGNGTTNDTTAWNLFQAAAGFKIVPAGSYLVSSVVHRFDQTPLGNGVFNDATAAWDQPMGDRERDCILVHGRTIDANATLVSPVIKTQTHINWEQNTSVGSFKHVVGSYHEATLDGFYNIQTDTNQNFTVAGSTVLNRMAGLIGSLAHLAYCEDTNETVNPLIATMGASKNGCSFMKMTRKAKYAYGGYMFGLEIYALNAANETVAVPYQNNDDFSFTAWTSGIKIAVDAGANGAPITTAMFTHGLGGKHGAWNGIVIGGSTFKINNNTQGVAGTVAINLSSHRDAAGFSDIGIKFRTNNRHIHANDGLKIRSSHSRFGYEAAACGISIEGNTGATQFLNFRDGATSAPDGGPVVNRAQIRGATGALALDSIAGEVQLVASGVTYKATSLRFAPAADGSKHCGGASNRWNTVYATTGTINTSDAREKTPLEDFPDKVLDAWGEVKFGQFQMRDAVKLKGKAARVHSGLIAQQINEVFKARGLDAQQYGLLCYDAWEAEPEKVEVVRTPVAPAVYKQVLVAEAVYEEAQGERKLVKEAVYKDGELITPEIFEEHRHVTPAIQAGNRYGIRYEEALCLEAAYQRRRMARIEARLVAMESA
jgi:hypothetical protein